MSNNDFVDAKFQQFVQQFHTEEQKVLLAFYRELVGKRSIPYKIKDRNFTVTVQKSQGFSIDIEFQDVLIEDGRHPKEIFMESLRGERLSDGRYRLSFINGLAAQTEGQVSKESSFSFSALKGGVRLWNYHVHMFDISETSVNLPWKLLYETLEAIREKHAVLGSGYLNTHEQKALWIFKFMRPYMQLYLDPTTQIGFGKSTVLFDAEHVEWQLNHERMTQAAEFFAGLGLRKLSFSFSKLRWDDRELIQELLYTMRSLKGNILFKTLKQLVDECGRKYDGLYEYDAEKNNFRSHVREKIQRIFERHGWKGLYPSFMNVISPEFIEVSSIYKRRYTYLNEKMKFIYFDFLESVVDGKYFITPITGMILPKKRNIDYRKCTSLDCFFLDGGRRNGAVFNDLTISEDMTRKEIGRKLEQLSLVLDYQTGN